MSVPSPVPSALRLLLIALTAVGCCRSPKVITRAPVAGIGELRLIRFNEFREFSCMDRFELELHRTGAGPETAGRRVVRLTGDVGTLPGAARYRAWIRTEDVRTRPGGSRMGMFGIHWVNPARLTVTEFEAVARTIRERPWPAGLGRTLDTLVLGDQRQFHEVFFCEAGLAVYTDPLGTLWITDDPAWDRLSEGPMGRHFDPVGRFDNGGRLHLSRGRLLGTLPGPDHYRRPSLPVRFEADALQPARDGRADVLWASRLYPLPAPGVNLSFFRTCKRADGRRLDEEFPPADGPMP